MEISKVIRRHGFSIADVARAMGIQRGSLSNAIHKGNPQISYLRRIGDIIGANITEFFEDERETALETPETKLFSLTAFIQCKGQFYRVDSLKELETITSNLRAQYRQNAANK